MVENLFPCPAPPRRGAAPRIYAYRDCNPQYAGLLKIGYRPAERNLSIDMNSGK
ncbi:MAG: hypothetical protein AB7F23_03540 [Phycisphaerae bacterium]